MTERGPRETAWRMVAAPLLTAKTICLIVPVLVAWTMSSSQGFPTSSEISSAFNQWDTQSYVHIARDGYPASTVDPHTNYLAGFFPGYPILIRLVTTVVGDPILAGLLISFAAEAVALYYFARLVIAERDAGSARFTIWLFALWPMAFFLTAVYTESTFIALAAAALFYARQDDSDRGFAKACLAAGIACSVRVTGIALIPALAWEVLVRKRSVLTPRWLMLALVPTPILAFFTYMHVHAADFFAYFTAQSSPSFNHHAAPPWVGLFRTLDNVSVHLAAHDTFVFGSEVLFGIAGATLCIALWLHPTLPRSLTIYCTCVWLVATSLNIWLSVPRYELAMFPGLIAISDYTRRHIELRAAIIGISCGFMTFGTTLYASGRWLG